MTFDIGIVTKLPKDSSGLIESIRSAGFASCHLSVYDPSYLTDAAIEILARDAKDKGVTMSALWAGYPDRVVWDLIEGPATAGVVPRALRAGRAALIKRSADLAASLGIEEVITHAGFIPENLDDPNYGSLLPVLSDIAKHCRRNGQRFCLETGQSTPTTLRRTLEDLGCDNVGVNFDPANLLVYGKGNPTDAVPILAPWIRSVHAKDGTYPTDGRNVGEEKPIGEGIVGFPRFLGALADAGYRGGIWIECDLPDDRRIDAIELGLSRLKEWLASLSASKRSRE
jgi:sugar phosphate isomerase/epimerase